MSQSPMPKKMAARRSIGVVRAAVQRLHESLEVKGEDADTTRQSDNIHDKPHTKPPIIHTKKPKDSASSNSKQQHKKPKDAVLSNPKKQHKKTKDAAPSDPSKLQKKPKDAAPSNPSKLQKKIKDSAPKSSKRPPIKPKKAEPSGIEKFMNKTKHEVSGVPVKTQKKRKEPAHVTPKKPKEKQVKPETGIDGSSPKKKPKTGGAFKMSCYPKKEMSEELGITTRIQPAHTLGVLVRAVKELVNDHTEGLENVPLKELSARVGYKNPQSDPIADAVKVLKLKCLAETVKDPATKEITIKLTPMGMQASVDQDTLLTEAAPNFKGKIEISTKTAIKK